MRKREIYTEHWFKMGMEVETEDFEEVNLTI
jgi:hypothetical protein